MKKLLFGVLVISLLITSFSFTQIFAGVNDNPSKPVYFVVSNPNVINSDSYILPLYNKADIEHARNLIKNPKTTKKKIIVAQIGKGSSNGQYVNRDVIRNTTWNWHIAKFTNFADATVEILDGSPSLVEQDIDGWISMYGGRIGFWMYTITRELNGIQLSK